MKKKLLNLSLIVFIGLLFATPAQAETNATDVKPNLYEENEVEINQDTINSGEQKEPLPEEQRNLTFEKPGETRGDEIKDELFLSSDDETNTITAKAEQLNLFSEEEKEVQREPTVQNQTGTEDNSSLMLFMVAGLVLVIAVMFFIIIPRFTQSRH